METTESEGSKDSITSLRVIRESIPENRYAAKHMFLFQKSFLLIELGTQWASLSPREKYFFIEHLSRDELPILKDAIDSEAFRNEKKDIRGILEGASGHQEETPGQDLGATKKRKSEQVLPSTFADVALVTALSEELEPIIRTFGGESRWVQVYVDKFKHQVTRIEGAGHSLVLVATSLWKYGSNPTVAEVFRLRYFRPKMLLMTGVCAGWAQKEIALGDVIVADRAFDTESGKRINHRFRPDTETYQPPVWLIQWLKNFKDNLWMKQIETRRPISLRFQSEWALLLISQHGPHEGWKPRIWGQVKRQCPQFYKVYELLRKSGYVTRGGRLTASGSELVSEIQRSNFGSLRPLPDPLEPRVHYGTVATTPSVSEDDKFFPEQEKRVRTVRAAEMEISAFFEAANEIGVPAFAVKGVCDYALPPKNDLFRPYASEASARWAVAFLQKHISEIALLHRPEKSKMR